MSFFPTLYITGWYVVIPGKGVKSGLGVGAFTCIRVCASFTLSPRCLGRSRGSGDSRGCRLCHYATENKTTCFQSWGPGPEWPWCCCVLIVILRVWRNRHCLCKYNDVLILNIDANFVGLWKTCIKRSPWWWRKVIIVNVLISLLYSTWFAGGQGTPVLWVSGSSEEANPFLPPWFVNGLCLLTRIYAGWIVRAVGFICFPLSG